MSKKTTIKTIYKEIEKVNDIIDMKILKGLSYARESKQHKFLLSCLVQAKREVELHKSISLINKLSHMVSSFIL